MPYTTPRTWTTSETVTAAMMNEQVRDNTAYLKTQMDIADRRQVIDNVTADGSSISGTTSETLMWSYQIPAGTVAATGMVRLIAYFASVNFSATGTLRLRLGGTAAATDGTVVASYSFASVGGTNYRRIEAVVKNQGSVSSQRAISALSGDQAADGDMQTAAIDMSSAQYLKLTYQPGHASDSAQFYQATLEVLTAV